jgi:hypothetical protein
MVVRGSGRLVANDFVFEVVVYDLSEEMVANGSIEGMVSHGLSWETVAHGSTLGMFVYGSTRVMVYNYSSEVKIHLIQHLENISGLCFQVMLNLQFLTFEQSCQVRVQNQVKNPQFCYY